MPKCKNDNQALFMPDVDGVWRCLHTTTDYVQTCEVLASVLDKYRINFPDDTVFARVRRYASGRCLEITFRAYDALRIVLQFNLNDL